MLRAVLFPVLLLVGLVPSPAPAQGAEAARIEPLYQALAMPDILQTVSYTHLTLPTIYSV